MRHILVLIALSLVNTPPTMALDQIKGTDSSTDRLTTKETIESMNNTLEEMQQKMVKEEYLKKEGRWKKYRDHAKEQEKHDKTP